MASKSRYLPSYREHRAGAEIAGRAEQYRRIDWWEDGDDEDDKDMRRMVDISLVLVEKPCASPKLAEFSSLKPPRQTIVINDP